MTAAVFVDSNVLLYAMDQADLRKQDSAQAWRAELWKRRQGRVSFQVLNEFYVNAIRVQPDARNLIRAEIRDLLLWNPILTDAAALETAWRIQDRYRLSYWDAQIVAAAKIAECRFLLTEDLQDGQNLDGVEVVNPFRHSPTTLL